MTKKPKILIFDIETSPLLGYAWVQREADLIEVVEKSYILSIAWQWYGEKKVYQKTANYRKDRAVCKRLAKLIKEADLLVYQNGDSFDLKVTRTRMLAHKLSPVALTATVDTLKQFRKYFKFPSNRLDEVCKYLGIGQKLKHPGFPMWKGCMNNEQPAQKIMARYNKHDVKITAAIYEEIKPWIHNHPNVALLVGKSGCPNCTSTNVKRDGVRGTTTTMQQQWYCKTCDSRFLTALRKNIGKAVAA